MPQCLLMTQSGHRQRVCCDAKRVRDVLKAAGAGDNAAPLAHNMPHVSKTFPCKFVSRAAAPWSAQGSLELVKTQQCMQLLELPGA